MFEEGADFGNKGTGWGGVWGGRMSKFCGRRSCAKNYQMD